MSTSTSPTLARPRKKNMVEIGFLANARRIRALVRVIQANTNTNYITHSEVIEHRAEHTRRWAHFRRSMLAGDMQKAIRRLKHGEGGVLVATRGRAILGLAVLTYDLKHHYGIVEDIVVNAHHRGEGIGRRLLAAATDAMREAGLENVILESGIRNESAHEFFRHHGFREAAKMFLRHLDERD
jgi:ribosomal protein S18 acetylase RimI-like enzyme